MPSTLKVEKENWKTYFCNMHIAAFTFNPFQENTYVLHDDTMECIIIDPGMVDGEEDAMLFEYIQENQLKPVMVVNTHCHIDHILGNQSATKQYQIPLVAHLKEKPMLERAPSASLMWDIPYRESPMPHQWIEEGEQIRFGKTTLDVLFVPGHAPGHIALVNHADKVVIAGDVLFRGSVGRVDLPMSNGADLVKSIQEKMYILPDDYTVFSGHGPETTIGAEKEHNSFVRADWQGLV